MENKYKIAFIVVILALIIGIIIGIIFIGLQNSEINYYINLIGFNSADVKGHSMMSERFSFKMERESGLYQQTYRDCEEEFDKKEYAVFKQFYQNSDGVYPIRTCLVENVYRGSISCKCFYVKLK